MKSYRGYNSRGRIGVTRNGHIGESGARENDCEDGIEIEVVTGRGMEGSTWVCIVPAFPSHSSMLQVVEFKQRKDEDLHSLRG